MINILGIFSIIVFYLLILGVGMWAASKKGGDEMDQEVRKLSNIEFQYLDYIGALEIAFF